MAKVKWDVSGSDPDDAIRSFEPPVPGIYTAKVLECKLGYKVVDGKEDKDQPRLEVVYEVVKGVGGNKYKGARLFDYLSFSPQAAFRMDAFLQSVGVATKTKRKGTLDTEAVVGLPVKIRVKGETYNNAYSAKVGGVFPASDEDLDDLDEDLEDDDEIEQDDEEEEETEDEETEDGASYSLPELEDLDRAALLALAKELDITPPADVRKRAKALAEWIFDNQPNPPDGEEEEEEESDDDYDSLDLDELKKELKARDIKIPAKASKSKLVDLLREDDNADPF